jgi:hypothetical protein
VEVLMSVETAGVLFFFGGAYAVATGTPVLGLILVAFGIALLVWV